MTMVQEDVTMYKIKFSFFGIFDKLNCVQFDLNVGVTGGTASWTGPGTWHPTPQQSICVDFYGNNKPTCCCTLPQTSLSISDGEVNLNCECFMP